MSKLPISVHLQMTARCRERTNLPTNGRDFLINTENARRPGLSKRNISRAIAPLYDGTPIGVYREGDELHQIIFRPHSEYRGDVSNLQDIRISPASGQYVPIAQVADDFEIVFANARLTEIDRTLAITAQAAPAPSVNAADLFEPIQTDAEAIPLTEGYALEWRGQHGNSQDANAGFASTIPLGFGAMVTIVFSSSTPYGNQ